MDLPEHFRRIYNAINPEVYIQNPTFAKHFLHWYFKTASHVAYTAKSTYNLSASLNISDEVLVRRFAQTVGLSISEGAKRVDRYNIRIVNIRNPQLINL